MDAQGNIIMANCPGQDSLLQTSTLLNFKVLFPKLMLSAWLTYIFIYHQEAITTIVFSHMQTNVLLHMGV